MIIHTQLRCLTVHTKLLECKLENSEPHFDNIKAASYSSDEVPEEKVITNEKKDSLLVSVENSSRVKSLDDLINNCNVDLSTWEVDWFDIGTYEVTGFDNDRKPVTVTMYRTKAKFKKIDILKNLAQLKDDLKQDLF